VSEGARSPRGAASVLAAARCPLNPGSGSGSLRRTPSGGPSQRRAHARMRPLMRRRRPRTGERRPRRRPPHGPPQAARCCQSRSDSGESPPRRSEGRAWRSGPSWRSRRHGLPSRAHLNPRTPPRNDALAGGSDDFASGQGTDRQERLNVVPPGRQRSGVHTLA